MTSVDIVNIYDLLVRAILPLSSPHLQSSYDIAHHTSTFFSKAERQFFISIEYSYNYGSKMIWLTFCNKPYITAVLCIWQLFSVKYIDGKILL